jgi:lysophospholipase L1-like esterase
MRRSSISWLRVHALTWLLAVLFSACGTTSPSAPSPPRAPSPPGSVALLTCPADIKLISKDGRPLPVTFPEPAMEGVGAVTKSSCTPSSGSLFRVGTTSVTCSLTEAAALTTACTFTVTIVGPPPPPPPPTKALTQTRFLAFGDSITEGYRPLAGLSFVPVPTHQYDSYPLQLLGMLDERYPQQTFIMIASAVGGERTTEGKGRLPQELNRHNPEVVMILEGINELQLIGPARAASDLKSMVRSAQARGVNVLIATLTPISDAREKSRPGLRDAINDLNQRIRELARELAIDPAVDLHRAFAGDQSLLTEDGLHPTTQGHLVMAKEFFDAIVSRFEIDLDPTTSSAVPSLPLASRRPPGVEELGDDDGFRSDRVR